MLLPFIEFASVAVHEAADAIEIVVLIERIAHQLEQLKGLKEATSTGDWVAEILPIPELKEIDSEYYNEMLMLHRHIETIIESMMASYIHLFDDFETKDMLNARFNMILNKSYQKRLYYEENYKELEKIDVFG